MKKVTTWLRGFIAAAGIAGSAATGGAQPGTTPFDPTHYWTYHVLDAISPPGPIFVQDQFFKLGIPVTVDSLTHLLNWVQKNNSEVPDSTLHYTWWNIVDKVPVNRTVLVTNQFGSFNVQVLNLEFLLAPALKNIIVPGLPQKNHYLCYKATGFPAPPLSYDFRDEWRVDFQHPQDIQYLCAPCLKQHGGLTYPVVDTVTHFAVYPITPASDFFTPFIEDQFAVHQHIVKQVPIEYLFVPSEKTERPVGTKRNTWGRLKQRYR